MSDITGELPWSEFGAQIPHYRLNPGDIPVGTRDWMVFTRFALTFDGYNRFGGFGPCADFANAAASRFRREGKLPNGLSRIRCCIFFEQRRWRHFDRDPDPQTWTYLDALMARARVLVLRRRN